MPLILVLMQYSHRRRVEIVELSAADSPDESGNPAGGQQRSDRKRM